MDSSGDAAILDFDLGELGAIASSESDRHADGPLPSSSELELEQALSAFDQQVATSNRPAAVCMVRVGFGPLASETVKSVVKTRVLQKFQRAARDGDTCMRCGNGDILLALAGCDVEAARRSISLMMKLFAVEMVHGPEDDMKISAGIAPYSGDARASQRTALLACDLASFQENGYIEVVEF